MEKKVREEIWREMGAKNRRERIKCKDLPIVQYYS
jgi:hypothetical protein